MMTRRKIFEVRVTLPITADLLARIDAILEPDEYRVDFIRDALKREIERRRPTPRAPKRAHHTSKR
jgi:metal-responsive CopG/Arc/MetJ family transcriptional regulator